MPALMALVLTLMAAAPLRAQPSVAPETQRAVLVLYAERTELPGTGALDASLVQSLTSGPGDPIDVYREAMDLSRLGSEEYLPLLRDYLRAKYAAKKFDVIVAVTGPALDFLLSDGDRVFPGTPIVFSGVDRREIARRTLPDDVTGVLLEREFLPTLQVALRLHPDTRQVVFVAGTTAFERRLEQQAREEFRRYEGQLAFTYLTTRPLDDALGELANLPPRTIVLYSTLLRDGAGEVFLPHAVAERVSAAANAPVYGFADQFMGRGIVGGQLYSMGTHGNEAADLVRKILSGAQPSTLPLREGPPGVVLFDWRQMTRWGISASALPAGSRILFRQPAAWDVYRPYIVAAGALVLLQSAFIVALLVQRRVRIRAEQALRESEERFHLMADTAPVLVWRTGTDGLCDFLNKPWLEFTGQTLEQSLGAGWQESIWPEDLDGIQRTYSSAFDARRPFQLECRLRRADGAYAWVLASGVPRYAPDGLFLGYIGSCIDISDRRAAEEALLESQGRYKLATAAGAVGVWDWNLRNDEVYVDPTLKRILGFEDAEIRDPEDWRAQVHPDDSAAVMARVQACIAGTTDAYVSEHRVLHKDGSVRWFLSRGTVLRRPNGVPYRMVGTSSDITDRKHADEAIREANAILQINDQKIEHLSGRLIAAQEVERARIARELHDDTSQQLAGLGIALSTLKRRLISLQSDDSLQVDVSSVQQRTIALAEHIRTLSHDLHPSWLEHVGLATALAAYCDEVRHQQSLEVTFSSEGNFDVADAQSALCLYRIAQEALHNVVAHAEARQAHVQLRRIGAVVELTIQDDGKGFDIVRARSGTGIGLVSINERAKLAGGAASIATELNGGTRITVQLPTVRHAQPGADLGTGRFAASG